LNLPRKQTKKLKIRINKTEHSRKIARISILVSLLKVFSFCRTTYWEIFPISEGDMENIGRNYEGYMKKYVGNMKN